MFLSPRLSAKSLSELSHRLATETEAGIDIRRTWQRESASARGRTRDEFDKVRDAVARGDSLSVALARTGDLLPPLFLEITHVGEQTGTLGRVFHRLSAHYRRLNDLKRMFLIAIAWPMIQLAVAVLVIGLLIWILGIVAQRNRGEPIDVLGLGLIGNRGVVIYANVIVAIGLVIAGLVVALRRGVFWSRPLQRAVMQLPIVGPCLEQLALARLTWVLHLTLNVELDLRRVVPLALRATGNDFYIRHTEETVSHVAQGAPLHQALGSTGAFRGDFLDALAVAEESGRTVESLQRLSKNYEEEAESALRALATIAGVAIWVFVAAILIWMIFRLAGFYFSTIQDALKM